MRRVGAYLVYLILITTVATAISFSRYGKTISGNEQASIAKVVLFQVPVSATLNGTELTGIESGISVSDILPGDTLVYNFNIVNYSGESVNQVSLKYRLEVDFTPDDPRTLPLTDDLTPGGLYPSAGDDWIYMGFGTQESHEYTLMVEWHDEYNDSMYKSQTQAVTVLVFAEQVD